jgi:hypothetical protein
MIPSADHSALLKYMPFKVRFKKVKKKWALKVKETFIK